MRFLAVDDDEIILEILGESVKAIGGHQIDTALSGLHALDQIAASERPYDCFLLDIQMPGMTGVELCALIRSQPAYRHTPIIMITAMSEKRYIDNAFTAGATDYVTKPFDFFELGARIKLAEQMLEKSKPARQELRSLDALTNQLLSAEVIHISDAIQIDDVEGVLNQQAFENYLMQLNRGLFYRATVFSVKVNNINAIFDQTSSKEFKDIVIDLSEAISMALQSYERFFDLSWQRNLLLRDRRQVSSGNRRPYS